MKKKIPLLAGFLALAGLALVFHLGCPKTPGPTPTPVSRGGRDKHKEPKELDKKGGGDEQPRIKPESFAIPKDPETFRTDLRDREYEAYDTLRAITVAQKHYSRDMKPKAKDLDNDGLGEFCYLLEICGISNLQTPGGKERARTLDSADWRWFRALDQRGKPMFWKYPPGKPEYYWEKQDGYEFLVFKFNMGVVHRINSSGIAERNGYLFALYLPGPVKAENAGGEVPPGDPKLADKRERRFVAYAWPKDLGISGRRAFFTDRKETVWACWNLKAKYSGSGNIPSPDAALDKGGPDPKNLDAEPGIAFDDSPTLDRVGLPPCDGETWKIFGERKGIRRKFEQKWSRDEEVEDYKKDGGEKQPWWGE